MSETQTEEQALKEAVDAPSPTPGAIIDVQQGGASSLSIDKFHEAMGLDMDDDPEPEESEEDLEEEGSEDEDELDEDEEDGEELQDEEDEEADDETEEDEEDEVLEEDDEESESDRGRDKRRTKPIKAKSPDGESITLDPDTVIVQNVDGEAREIRLGDHLNVVAGELTVNSRLGKIASYKEQLDQERNHARSQLEQRFEFDKKISDLVASGKTEEALFEISSRAGDPELTPGKLMRRIYANIAKAANKFQGMSKGEIEAHFDRIDAKWLRDKSKKREEDEKIATGARQFLEESNRLLAENGITQEEFHRVYSNLSARNELPNASPEGTRDYVLRRAIRAKADTIIGSVFDRIDPALKQNGEMINKCRKILAATSFTEDELEVVLRNHLGTEKKRIASNLSKKVRKGNPRATTPKKKSAGEKNVESKTFKGAEDLAKAFGFSY